MEAVLTVTGERYLDLANSPKPGIGGGANENYPRELLQLFTIGLWKLKPDGSMQLDAAQQPIPAYTQDTVRQRALALIGWTCPTAPGEQPRKQQPGLLCRAHGDASAEP